MVNSKLALAAVAAVALAPGCGGSGPKAPRIPAARAGPPKPPSPGAVVQGKEAGKLAVALAAAPASGKRLRLTATVVGQDANGVDGLGVTFRARGSKGAGDGRGTACGSGCYTALVPPVGKPLRVSVTVTGEGDQNLEFRMPSRWPAPSAAAFVRRATRAYLALRSASYVEWLSSGSGTGIVTRWKQVAPDRLEYRIRGGAAGIVIGTRRWDATSGSNWRESETQRIPNPVPIWSTNRVADAHVLRSGRGFRVVSFFNPSFPAWFTVHFDRRTLRPKSLSMTAPAHFMRHVYTSFDSSLRIVPPR
jgi:hypothetical protein